MAIMETIKILRECSYYVPRCQNVKFRKTLKKSGNPGGLLGTKPNLILLSMTIL